MEAEGGVDSFFEDFAPFLINPTKKDGSVYAIPHEGDTFLLYVNKRLWEEAGLDPVNNPPKTFEELKQANFQLTDKSKTSTRFLYTPQLLGYNLGSMQMVLDILMKITLRPILIRQKG